MVTKLRDVLVKLTGRIWRVGAPEPAPDLASEVRAVMLLDPSATAGDAASKFDISHVQARTLATLHQDSAHLCRLAATGEIPRGTTAAVRRDLLRLQRAASTESEETSPVTMQTQLAALLSYVSAYEPRGPVPGWEEIPALDPHEESMLPWTEKHPAANGTKPSTNGFGPTDIRGHATAPAVQPAVSPHGHREAVFDQIGGARAIEDLVETFYDMMVGDPELLPYFRGFSVAKIKQHQLQFLMAVTGGPNIYVGRPLRVAHAALMISPEHFDRTSEHLDATLTVKGVDPDHRALILARVAALKRHIASS